MCSRWQHSTEHLTEHSNTRFRIHEFLRVDPIPLQLGLSQTLDGLDCLRVIANAFEHMTHTKGGIKRRFLGCLARVQCIAWSDTNDSVITRDTVTGRAPAALSTIGPQVTNFSLLSNEKNCWDIEQFVQ